MAEVITVSGPISPEKLGKTMSHVHLLSELKVAEQKGPPPVLTASEQVLSKRPVTMDILGVCRRNAYAVDDNLILGDIDDAISELMFFKRYGGGSIAEASVVGLARDPVGLRQVAEATGVNIICGTGWYIGESHPAFVREASINELRDHMVRELTVGIDNTGIRTGFIKIALSSPTPDKPYSGSEEKALRAAARTQAETGAAMTMHPCHHFGQARHWDTYLDIIQEEGGNLEKCFLSHMEFWHADIDYQKSLIERGVTVAFDQFGSEEYARPGWRKPVDPVRVECIIKLVELGYASRIVLSNEVVRKHGLRKYGGHGYAHVLENITLDLKYGGVTEEQLNTMLIENPKRLFPF